MPDLLAEGVFQAEIDGVSARVVTAADVAPGPNRPTERVGRARAARDYRNRRYVASQKGRFLAGPEAASFGGCVLSAHAGRVC